MEKIKSFIKKYKTEILIALGAISSIIASISTMSTSNATICGVLIAILAVIIAVLKNGLTDATIELLAKAIKIIIEALETKQNTNVSASAEPTELTIEDIKKELLG